MLQLLNVITAGLHLALPTRDVEALCSAALIGSLFAIWALPCAVLYALAHAANVVPVLPWLLVVYLLVIWLDPQHLKAPSDRPECSKFRSLNVLERASLAFWSAHFRYFPLTCEFGKGAEAAIDPNRNYVFAVHPHGIHCWPLNVFAFVTSTFYERFPSMRVCGAAATIMFKLPVIREMFLTMQYRDAGRRTCEKVLQSKRSLFICTGGEAESLGTETGVDKVVLEGR